MDMLTFGLLIILGLACGFLLAIPLGHLAVWVMERANTAVIDDILERQRIDTAKLQ